MVRWERRWEKICWTLAMITCSLASDRIRRTMVPRLMPGANGQKWVRSTSKTPSVVAVSRRQVARAGASDGGQARTRARPVLLVSGRAMPSDETATAMAAKGSAGTHPAESSHAGPKRISAGAASCSSWAPGSPPRSAASGRRRDMERRRTWSPCTRSCRSSACDTAVTTREATATRTMAPASAVGASWWKAKIHSRISKNTKRPVKSDSAPLLNPTSTATRSFGFVFWCSRRHSRDRTTRKKSKPAR
mmetsp:Transcript_12162/g.34297  ORF Transcript_12162/g.34297 Transcript_12162/m.34297 type:complete len:248 (-) Transcript_12162:139-882(-)